MYILYMQHEELMQIEHAICIAHRFLKESSMRNIHCPMLLKNTLQHIVLWSILMKLQYYIVYVQYRSIYLSFLLYIQDLLDPK